MTRIAIINVCAWPSWARASGLSSFEKRVEAIAAKLKAAKVDIIAVQELALTTESGEANYKRGKLLSGFMGWGGIRVKDESDPSPMASFVQHGNYAPVATALLWNPQKSHALATGRITTYDGWPRNNGATWGDLVTEGKRGRYTVTHLEFEPRGVNNIPKYDRIRYQQTDGSLDQLQHKGRTNFLLADANCDLDDARDGFGNACHDHGLEDFDEISKGRQHGSRTTSLTGNGNGMRIIRGACTKDVRCTWQDTINMAGLTDHNALVQEFTIPF